MRRLISVVFLTVSFVVGAFGQSAALRAIGDENARSFALNNLTFALYHEVGHLLINEFSLPVLGKEEDAADNIATMLLLAKQAAAANAALMDSARGWQYSGADLLPATGTFPEQIQIAAMYDSHSADHVRAGQIGCLMVGSRREVFAHVALDLQLDQPQEEACAHNLGQIVKSWVQLRSQFISIGAPLGEIAIEYAQNDGFIAEANMLKDAKLLENVRLEVLANYALPRPLKLRADSCGTANAYFDPNEGEILICYELAAFYVAMAAQVSS